MLHYNDSKVRDLLFHGGFGLEKESLRVDQTGHLAHTPHPFGNDDHIVRDFCENQTEINTGIHDTPEQAVKELEYHNLRIQKKLASLQPREYLWPFSNPPYIRDEKDIPVARFGGKRAGKTAYRDYLGDRYGRYIMTFSGIHVNFSFADELLQADFALSEYTDFQEYKDQLYLELAKKATMYAWILTAVTAASPWMDSSYFEKGLYGRDAFTGMASVRSSELGYWNFFVPVLDYSSWKSYVASIRAYIECGFLATASELYYPIRLKVPAEYNIENLEHMNISHIELRMFDLNPLVPCGLDVRDVAFAHLFLIWLSCLPDENITEYMQVQAVHNFKSAARYDLKTVTILGRDGKATPVADFSYEIIRQMKKFYKGYSERIDEVLDFEESKFTDPENRYAWQVRRKYGGGFVEKGMDLARKYQKDAVEQLQ